MQTLLKTITEVKARDGSLVGESIDTQLVSWLHELETTGDSNVVFLDSHMTTSLLDDGAACMLTITYAKQTDIIRHGAMPTYDSNDTIAVNALEAAVYEHITGYIRTDSVVTLSRSPLYAYVEDAILHGDDPAKVPFMGSSVDTVVADNVLSIYRDPLASMAAIKAMVAPGGIVIAVEKVFGPDATSRRRRLTRVGLRDLFDGLVPVSSGSIGNRLAASYIVENDGRWPLLSEGECQDVIRCEDAWPTYIWRIGRK